MKDLPSRVVFICYNKCNFMAISLPLEILNLLRQCDVIVRTVRLPW